MRSKEAFYLQSRATLLKWGCGLHE